MNFYFLNIRKRGNASEKHISVVVVEDMLKFSAGRAAFPNAVSC